MKAELENNLADCVALSRSRNIFNMEVEIISTVLYLSCLPQIRW
jgi:hypothetical protein